MARSKHDAFFCRSLEHPAVTKDFLKQYIPPHLKQQVIWESLYRIDRSNTDLELKKRHRDILYRASMLQGEDVILGIEHQSKEDPIMQIRYLRYDMDVLEACVKAGYDKWPLIINLLLYNGQKAPSSHLSEPIGYYRYTIDGKEHIHLFYYLINLMQISDEELLTHGLCAPMEILLKHSFDGEFKLNLSAYQAVFHACVKVVGEDYIHSMLKYADSLANFKIGRKMHKFVEEVFPDKPKIIMTYGQMLKREAKREGKREGSIAIAKNMINKGYDIKSIQEITELPKETIEKLKAE